MLNHLLNNRGASRADTLIKLALLLFVSLFFFSVGTFVGKQFSDSQHRLAEHDQAFENENKEVSSTEKDLSVKPSDALTDKDVEELAKEFMNTEKEKLAKHDEHGNKNNRDVASDDHAVKHDKSKKDDHTVKHEEPKKDDHAVKHEEPKKGDHAVKHEDPKKDDHAVKHEDPKKDDHTVKHEDPKKDDHAVKHEEPKKDDHAVKHEDPKKEHKDHSQINEVAKKVAHNESTHKEEIRKVTAIAPTEALPHMQGKFTLQMSSHNKTEEAESKKNDLVKSGYSAFVVNATVGGKTWYRVNVGLFASKQEAFDFHNQVKSKPEFTSSIVQKLLK